MTYQLGNCVNINRDAMSGNQHTFVITRHDKKTVRIVHRGTNYDVTITSGNETMLLRQAVLVITGKLEIKFLRN